MTHLKNWPPALACLAGIVLTACMPYVPPKDPLSRMSVETARKAVSRALTRNPEDGEIYFCDTAAPDPCRLVTSARAFETRLRISCGLKDKETALSISFKDMEIVVIDEWEIRLTATRKIRFSMVRKDARPRVYGLADALHTLKVSAPVVDEAAKKDSFDKAAQAYRAASPKPDLPESARRFKIQAEGAVRDKNLDAAADLYAQALTIAPWWPEGRYNRALVLAETSDYAEAVAEMNRYLALVPDAANARAAQDKIYAWEGKAR